jgi:hypothetical protein
MVRIPYYYEIPPSFNNSIDYNPRRLNSTHSILNNYPLDSIEKTYDSHVIDVVYNSIDKPTETLLVRINNYNNTSFAANDMVNIKVCWPATTPIGFDLTHLFSSEFDEDKAYLGLYVAITYKMDAASYDERNFSLKEHIKFQLYLTKLPNKWLPIPLELYDIITYLVDISIVIGVVVAPYLYKAFFS